MFARIVFVVGAAVLLAMAEVQRLAGESLSRLNRPLHLGEVAGPIAFAHQDTWDGWKGVPGSESPAGLIATHIGLDALFMAAYAILAMIVISRFVIPPAPAPLPVVLRELRRQRYLTVLLGSVLLTDVVEDVLLGLAAGHMEQGAAPDFAFGIAIAATAKWVLTVWLISSIFVAREVRRRLFAWLANARTALRVHRLPAVIVAILIVLSLLPVSLVLEQQPDIERAWFNADGSGVVHGLFALVSIVVVAIGYFLVARKRSADDFRAHVLGLTIEGYPRDYTSGGLIWRRWPGRLYGLWFALPILTLAGGLLFWRANPHLVDPVPFALFLGVTTGIPAISLIAEWGWWWYLRHHPGANVPVQTPSGPSEIPRSLFVARAGDLLSTVMISIAALGLARALFPHLALAAAGRTGPDVPVPLYVAAVLISLATAVLFFVIPRNWIDPATYGTIRPAASRFVDRVHEEFSADRVTVVVSPIARRLAWGGAILAGLIIGSAVLVPRTVGGFLGTIAMVVLSLGAWTLLVGLAILWLRRRRPLAIFELLGLRADPIITLFIVVPIIIGFVAPNPETHRIDQSASATPARPTLQSAFIHWNNNTTECVAEVEGTMVRPLVLIAAEGGGIRAAAWTADVLAELVEDGECTANSVFLSSGVSGGSVGLAIAAKAGSAEQMRSDVVELSGSAALPTAVSGLVISDPLASATGLRLSSLESPGVWRDRASLIEQSWRDAVPGLGDAFSTASHPATGFVVLNSTDLRSGCRVAISQIRLDTGNDWADEGRDQFTVDGPACKQNTQEPPLTVDLISAYRQCSTSYRGDWATSAMLSARFPYVTPSGRIDVGGVPGDDCPHTMLELIDGGYAENSGLGLISDISPRLAALIRAENAKGGTPIVPYLVYIQNSPGGYVTESPRNNTTQLIVPILGQGTKAEQLAPSSWIQRIMTTLDAGSPTVTSAAQRTVIVAISAEPAVNVPLGWGLSDSTETRLRRDAQRQADADGCLRPTNTHVCLANLLAVQ